MAYARDAFFLLRGLTGASLPASAPASLAGGGPGVAFAGDGDGAKGSERRGWPD